MFRGITFAMEFDPSRGTSQVRKRSTKWNQSEFKVRTEFRGHFKRNATLAADEVIHDRLTYVAAFRDGVFGLPAVHDRFK